MSPRRLPLLLVAVLGTGPVFAQSTPNAAPSAAATSRPDDHTHEVKRAIRAATTLAATSEKDDVAMAAARAELDAARKELQAASARMAELYSRESSKQIEAALRRPAFARPMLGIVMTRDPDAGVKLLAVTPDSPAADAGLRTGDRLLRVAGTDLDAADADARLAAAQAAIGKLDENEQVRVIWQRDGQRHDTTLAAKTLPGLTVWSGNELQRLRDIEVPSELLSRIDMKLGSIAPFAGCAEEGRDCDFVTFSEAWRWQGLQLAKVGSELGRYFGTDRGVLVLSAPDDAMAALRPGDVIQWVDGERVDTPQQAMRALRSKAPGTPLDIAVLRDRKTLHASVEAPKRPRFVFPAPPAPPAPPAAPQAAPAPAPAPPAAPSPPEAPSPPPAPPAPDGPRGVLESVLQ